MPNDNALHTAALKGDLIQVQSQVENFNINAKGNDDETALVKAAARGHIEVVRLLLRHNPNVNIPDTNGYTALLWASEGYYTEVVKELLKAPDINVNHTNNDGITPLIRESQRGNTEAVVALLSAPTINVNLTNNEDGFTALLWASFYGHIESVKALLTIPGIDVNHGDRSGTTALSWASGGGHTEAVKELLTMPSINVNLTKKDGATALMLSSKGGHAGVVAALLTMADINVNLIDNKDGSTALMLASQGGHTAVVAALLTMAGINVNQTNKKDGSTALMLASQGGHAGVVAELLKMPDINVNHVDNDGVTPLLTVARAGKFDIFIALVNHGADVTIKDKQGKTCFDVMKSAKEKFTVLTNIELKLSSLEAHNYALWFTIVQVTEWLSEADLFAKLLVMVEALVSNYPSLAAAKDAEGRVALDVASKPMKLVMQSVLLWHGRYRITESRPEHISATCCVFKAIDGQTIDKETNQPIKVALKLMRSKDQFQREHSARNKGFNYDYVMQILQTHPEVGSSTFDNWPDEVVDVEADATGQLTKANAEKFYLLVMPLADRNLFVALKQERWAGKNMEEVRHVFVQLTHCVKHMHEKGVLHADLKPLNFVRIGGQWKLIDFDASCAIGKESVGHKSSSAYVPPEAIYVDENTDSACVRSVVAVTKNEAKYELLTAHPSFDVWSLGCILYQMCTVDVKPLFQGGQDDNLTDDQTEEDNLFSLAKWSHWKKAKKLLRVDNPLARNLLGQMLHKDPMQRPTLARVLGHPFLSGKKVARLVGENPKYDIFLSYRVASDSQHVEKLYNLLTAQGFKVYWDKLCLEPGVDWEQGFCEGLVSSRTFVPLLSRDAINHPSIDWQNFSKLTADSNCDNVFLEHRLAVELQGLGLIEKIFPVFVGNLDATTSEYSDYLKSGCNPTLPEITVKSVEEKLRHHMENQALGTPLVPDRTIASVVGAITAFQGAFIIGPADVTFAAAATSIAKMLTDVPFPPPPVPPGSSHDITLSDMVDRLQGKVGTLTFEKSVLKSENESLQLVKTRQETILASLTGDVSQFASVEALVAYVQALLQS